MAPGAEVSKLKALNQAAAPYDPAEAALLPVPEAGTAGAWEGAGEGSAVG